MNFPPYDIVTSVGRVLLAISLLLKCPLVMVPLRSTLQTLWLGRRAKGVSSLDSPTTPVLRRPVGAFRNKGDGSAEAEDGKAEPFLSGGPGPESGDHQGLEDVTVVSPKTPPAGRVWLIGLTMFLLSLAWCAAVLVSNIALLYSIVGATCGCMICYVLPAWVFLLTPASPRQKAKAVVVLVFGVISMCASMYAIFSPVPS
jgi:hypothetical protein